MPQVGLLPYLACPTTFHWGWRQNSYFSGIGLSIEVKGTVGLDFLEKMHEVEGKGGKTKVCGAHKGTTLGGSTPSHSTNPQLTPSHHIKSPPPFPNFDGTVLGNGTSSN